MEKEDLMSLAAGMCGGFILHTLTKKPLRHKAQEREVEVTGFNKILVGKHLNAKQEYEKFDLPSTGATLVDSMYFGADFESSGVIQMYNVNIQEKTYLQNPSRRYVEFHS